MRSDAQSVAEYISAHAGEAGDALRRLREIIRDAAPDATESMKYGMPTYERGGDVFAFAQQKRHLSVYIHRTDLIDAHADKIGKHSRGKNCVRYTRHANIDFAGLSALIEAAYRR